ncbi:hypothetical protein M8J77_002321 [Diaphorina citri]|nr:hypothetical protein M8J77_002321 [Diaphorina citri]
MNFSPDLYSDLPTANTSSGRPPFHDEIIAVSNTPPFGPGIRYTWQVLWIHGFSRWISSISRRATEWTASTTDFTTHDEFSLQSIWTDGFVASLPPQYPVVLDKFGRQLNSTIGPQQEGEEVILTCRVVGGK